MRHPELAPLGVRRKLESRRHDPNNGVGAPAEVDRPTDHLWIAAKVSLPKAVARDQHRIIAWTSLVRKKGAADQRPRFKEVEKARTRDEPRELYLHSTPIKSQRGAKLPHCHNGFNRIVVGNQVREQWRRRT